MAVSLDRENKVDFRAPPPSPVAAGRRSSFANDDVLSEFLEHSLALRVPDLVLPDRVFPRQKPIHNPPKFDLESLNSAEGASLVAILESISQTGCFELVNHTIPRDLIRSVSNIGAGIFELAPEKKATVSRSPERPYGFVELHIEEERESSEEFVWCGEEALKLEMEGIFPLKYSNFSDKMESLVSEIEKIAAKCILILEKNVKKESAIDENCMGMGMAKEQELHGSICYLYKHCRSILTDERMNSLRYDVIRMLIRGSEHAHALCLHICDGSSEFHVYSKKGWVSFCPDQDALVVTIGDRLQAWSGGGYKHVIGRPIFNCEDDRISMAFLYSPPAITVKSTDQIFKRGEGNIIISLRHQAIFILILVFFYHVFFFIYKYF